MLDGETKRGEASTTDRIILAQITTVKTICLEVAKVYFHQKPSLMPQSYLMDGTSVNGLHFEDCTSQNFFETNIIQTSDRSEFESSSRRINPVQAFGSINSMIVPFE
jgi:hypothetical protein